MKNIGREDLNCTGMSYLSKAQINKEKHRVNVYLCVRMGVCLHDHVGVNVYLYFGRKISYLGDVMKDGRRNDPLLLSLEPGHSISKKIARALSEHSDQPARMRWLI